MTEPKRMNGAPRRILLATDLSARCDRALDRARALSQAWNAELIAVHAMEQTESFYASELQRRLPSWRRSPDPIRTVEEQLRRDVSAGPQISSVVERGAPVDVILRAAKARECDLIVTGIARDETLGRFGLGATVDRLLRRSKTPLLIAKQRVHGHYGHIVVATDFSEPSRHALQAALAFFPGRKLDVFHAYDPPMAGRIGDSARLDDAFREAAAAEATAFLANSGGGEPRRRGFGLLLERGEPSELIHQYVRERRVDLVVLGTHGRSAMFDVLIGSTAKAILASLPCDALVVRGPRSAVEANDEL